MSNADPQSPKIDPSEIEENVNRAFHDAEMQDLEERVKEIAVRIAEDEEKQNEDGSMS